MGNAPELPQEFALGYDLFLSLSDEGFWYVRSDSRKWPLLRARDFYRVWVMLERPFAEVQAGISELNFASRFPFENVIASAFSGSANWTDLAIHWVPFLEAREKASLYDLLVEIQLSKTASQKTRQLARKFAQEIERWNKAGGIDRPAGMPLLNGFETIDAILDEWAKAHAVVWLTNYQDEDVRTFLLNPNNKNRVQIWVDPPEAGHTSVHIFQAKFGQHPMRIEDLPADTSELPMVLNRALNIAMEWSESNTRHGSIRESTPQSW